MLNNGFKDSQIGPIPFEWKIYHLSEASRLIMGQSPPSSTYNTDGHGLPFLQGKSEFGSTHPSPVKWCSQPQRVANKGSILISVRAPVGDVNVAKDEYCIGRGLASIDVNKLLLDNWFLFYQLVHAKKRLEGRGTGSTFKSINKGVLQDFLVIIPTLPEQRAIANVLNTVREAIEATERVIASASELKRSIMKHLFTYGPVPIDQADQVPLRETEIGEMPEEWELLKVGEFAIIKAGGTPSRSKPEYWNGNIPWVKTGEINYNVITRTEETISQEGLNNSSAKLFSSGTLLMAMYGQGITRGRVAVLGIDASINQACAAFLLPNSVVTDYLFHFFTYHYDTIRSLGHGAHQKNLSATLLKTFPVALPPISEQKMVAKIISGVNKKIQIESQKKNALESIFSSLLNYLMTGTTRVQF